VGDGDDVGVIEPRRRLGLALEALGHLVEPAQLGVQELERQLLLHHGVLDAIHRAHAALAERGQHPAAIADQRADERIAFAWRLLSVHGACGLHWRAPPWARRPRASTSVWPAPAWSPPA